MSTIKKRRYIAAFLITSSIFFIGFFFGFLMDLNRIDYLEDASQEQKLNIRSLQLQSDFIKETSGENQCSVFRYMFDKTITELEKNRERLDIYQKQTNVKKDDFSKMKREYTLSQLNFWQISKNLKKTCPNSSDYVTIVYIYSDNKKCPDCQDQEIVLNYYKSLLKEDLLIFSIDEQFEKEESLISLIKQSFGINAYPTLIIDNEVYNESIGKEKLRNILIEKYSTEKNKNKVIESSQ
ncbi:MAG: hypothetical protein V1859_08515 [archaeon]